MRQSFYFLIMVAASAITVAKSLVFAKILSVEDFGYLALYTLVVSYGTILLPLGLVNGLNREFPVLLGTGDEVNAIRLRNGALTLVALIALLLLIPYLVSSYVYSDAEKVLWILITAYFSIMVGVVYQVVSLELRGRQLILEFSLVYLLQACME